MECDWCQDQATHTAQCRITDTYTHVTIGQREYACDHHAQLYLPYAGASDRPTIKGDTTWRSIADTDC